MDKEDALVVFQQHIRTAEKQYDEERQLEEKRIRRHERKIREAFGKRTDGVQTGYKISLKGSLKKSRHFSPVAEGVAFERNNQFGVYLVFPIPDHIVRRAIRVNAHADRLNCAGSVQVFR